MWPRYRRDYLPDFSDRGNSVARKSWMRPEKIMFCDFDSLRTMSATKETFLIDYTSKKIIRFREALFHIGMQCPLHIPQIFN